MSAGQAAHAARHAAGRHALPPDHNAFVQVYRGNADGARWQFRPGRVATLATALLLPVLLALGAWQLQRAAQKEALLERWAAQAALPPLAVGLDDLPVLCDPGTAGRRLVLRGRWDARRQVLLDNQVRHGISGYRLFTPLRIAGNRAVLVDRGWLAGGPHRELAPAVPPASGEVALIGIAAPPPGLRPAMVPARRGTGRTLRRTQPAPPLKSVGRCPIPRVARDHHSVVSCALRAGQP